MFLIPFALGGTIYMSDEPGSSRFFVDSNVWLYIFLPGQDVDKGVIAKQLVRQSDAGIIISTQVVNEVVQSILRHGAMNESEIRELISRFYSRYVIKQLSEEIQVKASQLRERYSLSHWDSLIIAAALAAGAIILYSEDMQDHLVVEGTLTIINPFLQ